MRKFSTFFIAAICLGISFATAPTCAVTIASDNASDAAYADGWQAGDNGGSGFGPWSFDFSGILGDYNNDDVVDAADYVAWRKTDGTTAGYNAWRSNFGSVSGLFHDPQFIDNGPLVGNSLGAPAFALTTGAEPYSFVTSEVRRTFNLPIAIGQTFSADVDGSALDPRAPAYTIGNTFQFFGTNGSERFGLFTNNDPLNGNWTATGDANTGILAGSSFHIEFTLATVNTYNLVLSPIAGGPPLFTQTGAHLTGTPGVGINRIRISAYGTGSSIDGSKEIFFDNLTISGPDATINAARDSVVTVPELTTWSTILVAFVSTINFRHRRAVYKKDANRKLYTRTDRPVKKRCEPQVVDTKEANEGIK